MPNLFQTGLWIPKQSPVAGNRADYIVAASSRSFDHPCYFDIDFDIFGYDEHELLVTGNNTPWRLLPPENGLSRHLTNIWLIQGWTTLRVFGHVSFPSVWINEAYRPSAGWMFDEVVSLGGPFTFDTTIDISSIFPDPDAVDWGVRGTIGKTRSYGYQADGLRYGEPSQLEWMLPQNYEHIGEDFNDFISFSRDPFRIFRNTDVVTNVFKIGPDIFTNFDLVGLASCQANGSVLRQFVGGQHWYYIHCFRVSLQIGLEDQDTQAFDGYEWESGNGNTGAGATFRTVYATPGVVVGDNGVVGQVSAEGLDVSIPIYAQDDSMTGEDPDGSPTTIYLSASVNAAFSDLRKRSTATLIG